jgi:hypothetical protein
MAPRRSWTFWVLYLSIVTILIGGVLDVVAGMVMRRRLETLLAIFDCILCDGTNVLTPTPRLTRMWDASPAFTVTVRTNARGFREDVDFEDADVDVAFMGDSFAFGWGVEGDARVSNVVAGAVPNARVVSLSYNNGFQPEHYEFFLTRHPELRPKVVVILLCLSNDLDSDLRETTIVRAADGTITDVQLPYRGLYFGAMRGAAVYRPWPLGVLVRHTNVGKMIGSAINQSPDLRTRYTSPDVVTVNTANPLELERGHLTALSARTFEAIERITARVASWGGVVHVGVIPQDVDFGAPPSPAQRLAYGEAANEIVGTRRLTTAVLTECGRRGVSCIDLTPGLTLGDYIAGDGHWTAAGHAKVAQQLAPVVRRGLEEAPR